MNSTSNLYKLIGIFGCVFSIASHGASLPTIELKIGKEIIKAEVASTPASRELGLMYRKTLPENTGMLFVFDQKAGHCFWMRNTLIPLSVAFIDDDGKIVNIDEMKPQTEDNHCPTKTVRYALEMNTQWFDKKQISAGRLVEGLPKP
jgi:uncharacterized membrane protein (UPF0127 family)